MIELIKAIIFGIVEGITEWLPISSTGHMILLDEIMPLNVTADFLEMFLVVIQLGAILAVVVIYWKRLFPFGVAKGPGQDKINRRPADDDHVAENTHRLSPCGHRGYFPG